MTPAEFVDRALSVPYVRPGGDWSGVDCFGLVVMWHRHVFGVELGDVPDTDIASGFAAATGWERCGVVGGATAFMAFIDGAPQHCGVVLDEMNVLHAHGNEDRGGHVKVSRISALQRIYSDIQFFRRATC